MNIGPILQQKLKDNHKTVVWLARELGCQRSHVYRLFEKYSIDTQTLERISVIMNFNFFSLYDNETEQKLEDKIENRQQVGN